MAARAGALLAGAGVQRNTNAGSPHTRWAELTAAAARATLRRGWHRCCCEFCRRGFAEVGTASC